MNTHKKKVHRELRRLEERRQERKRKRKRKEKREKRKEKRSEKRTRNYMQTYKERRTKGRRALLVRPPVPLPATSYQLPAASCHAICHERRCVCGLGLGLSTF
jgi:hypothetical protein